MKSPKTTRLPSTAKTPAVAGSKTILSSEMFSLGRFISHILLHDEFGLWNFPSCKIHVLIVWHYALIWPDIMWIDFKIFLSVFFHPFPIVYLYFCLFVYIYPSWIHGRQGRAIRWQKTPYGAASNKETIFSLACCDPFLLHCLCQR